MTRTVSKSNNSRSDGKRSATKLKADPFAMRDPDEAARAVAPEVHIYGPNARCITETRGYPTPKNRPPTEIVVDATNGFIPLWEKNSTLRWRFQERSLAVFQNPDAARDAIRELFGSALVAWGSASPVKFTHDADAWDFEVVMMPRDNCNPNGCVLASAFFPETGQNELTIYPKMFTQTPDEQIETLVHEIGHVYGLRHFFAQISENRWPSEIFGTHKPLSIMNYGSNSKLTDDDRSDLTNLYAAVWDGRLDEINGTRFQLMKPFTAAGPNTF